jgi:hypothetical protein
MHVILKKAIEVAHLLVAERTRDGTDLGWWEDTEQPSAKSQPYFYLKLQQRFPVSCHEIAMQRAHLYTQFASNGTHVKLHVAMMSLDEVMDEASRVSEEPGVKVFAQRRPHSSDFGNHLLFDGRQFSGKSSCHRYSLKASTSTKQRRCGQDHDPHCVCISPRGAHIGANGVGSICDASQFGTSRECRDAQCQDRTSEARFCASSSRRNYWEQAKLSWQLFLNRPHCRERRLQGRYWRQRATFKRNLFELHRRLLHHRRCRQNPPLFLIINTANRSAFVAACRKCERRSMRTLLQTRDRTPMPQTGFAIFKRIGSELPTLKFILIGCVCGRFR